MIGPIARKVQGHLVATTSSGLKPEAVAGRMGAMLAAITLAGAGAAALVAVVLYVVVRVVWWIWRWLDQSIVVSSWGLLLEGFND